MKSKILSCCAYHGPTGELAMQTKMGAIVLCGADSRVVIAVFNRLLESVARVDVAAAAQILLSSPELLASARRWCGWQVLRSEESEILGRVDSEISRLAMDGVVLLNGGKNAKNTLAAVLAIVFGSHFCLHLAL